MIWNACSYNGYKVFDHLPSDRERMEAYRDMAAMIVEQMGKDRIGITQVVQEAENRYCMHWTVSFACNNEHINTPNLAFQKALNEGQYSAPALGRDSDQGDDQREQEEDRRKNRNTAILCAVLFVLGFLFSQLVRFLDGF